MRYVKVEQKLKVLHIKSSEEQRLVLCLIMVEDDKAPYSNLSWISEENAVEFVSDFPKFSPGSG